MVYVRTVEEFYAQNEQELRTFFLKQTGIIDKDLTDETIQEFYVRLIRTKALEKFIPDERYLGSNRNPHFETYICNLFCWILPYMKKQNFRVKYDVVTTVTSKDNKEYDIWDVVGNSNSLSIDYNIASGYYADQIGLEDNAKLDQMVSAFFHYIEKTEEPEKASRMVSYVKYKAEGLKGSEIAELFNVSNSSVFLLKNEVQKKMENWRERWERNQSL